MSWRRSSEYGDRTCSAEFAWFALVFSTFVGLGREATIFHSRLADLLTTKCAISYKRCYLGCTVPCLFICCTLPLMGADLPTKGIPPPLCLLDIA